MSYVWPVSFTMIVSEFIHVVASIRVLFLFFSPKSVPFIKCSFFTDQSFIPFKMGFPDSSVGKESACMQETLVQFLDREDPLEEE